MIGPLCKKFNKIKNLKRKSINMALKHELIVLEEFLNLYISIIIHIRILSNNIIT